LEKLKAAADEAEQARIDAFFNGQQSLDALDAVNKTRQAERDASANKKKADDALKAEQSLAEKRVELNARTDQAIIEAQIDATEKGTTERLKLELELNELVRAAAIENAKAINADVAKVNELFDRLAEARKRDQERAAGAGPELEPGATVDPEVVARREADEEIIRLAEERALRLQSIHDQETEWAVDAAQEQTDAVLQAGAQTLGALGSMFSKHKGFAIGMAIIDTATAIMSIWAKWASVPYVAAALTAAAVAVGVAQIQRIRSATIDGGGNLGGSGGGGGAAANPTFAQSGSAGPPPAFTDGGVASMSSMSQGDVAALSGRSNRTGGQTVVVNIRNAFGDRRSMRKLTREVTRVMNHDPSVLR
jgi:hypothetical protein